MHFSAGDLARTRIADGPDPLWEIVLSIHQLHERRREPVLGVSRTTLAMARDRHLPYALAAVHPRFKVPHRAELLVGAVVAVLVALVDGRGAIGFSSFGVLAYYAIANASAWTLAPDEGRPARVIPVVGLAGCLVLAFALPLSLVISGAVVLVFGAAAYGLRRAAARR
jgi:APA family basic amino acid/polyamine antiporter